MLVPGAWAILGIALAWCGRRRPAAARLAALLASVACACVLAAALTAAQILPALEFAGTTERLGEGNALNVYRFSLEPHRVIELVWPNVFGTLCPENRSWLRAILPTKDREPWIVSLYMGGLSLILALNALGTRDGPPWRAWLTAVAAVGLVASLGKFASPLWWARWGPLASASVRMTHSWPSSADDPFLYDGAGSPFAILALLLPGFGVFRYPCKLLTLTAAALAVLAGAGWDRLVAGQARRLQAARLGRARREPSRPGAGPDRRRLDRRRADRPGAPDPTFGPADIPAAWAATQRALAQGAIVFAAGLVLAHATPRRPRLGARMALLVLTGDLALANAGLIWTVPQADFEAPPEAARRIAAAERDRSVPAPGPFRIHRMPDWLPPRFVLNRSPRRLARAGRPGTAQTLQPLYALPLGLDYCTTQGILELDDHRFFFSSEMIPLPAAMAQVLGLPAGRPVRYYPQARVRPLGCTLFPPSHRPPRMGQRGARLRLVPGPRPTWSIPARESSSGENDRPGTEPWTVREDWQLRRNRAAYPRAWLVHAARIRAPATSLAERQALMHACSS